MRWLIAAIVLQATVARASDWRSDFCGWAYDSSAYCVEEHNAQMHDGWKACPLVRAPETDCGNTDGTGTGRFVVLPRGTPRGVDVTIATKPRVDKDGKRAKGVVLTIRSGAKTIKHEAGEVATDPTITRTDFSPDLRRVAVSFSFMARRDDDVDSIGLVVVDISSLGLKPASDPKLARASNIDGIAAMRRGDWAAARTAFEKAIGADLGHVLAHYNLASVASIDGDWLAARRELAWLAGSSVPAAKAALKTALADADLDFASIDPDARNLIGMPAYPSTTKDRLAERHGIWSTNGESCKRPATIVTFAAGGKLGVATIDECKGKRDTKTATGTWKDDGQLILDVALGALPAKATLEWEACDQHTPGDPPGPDGSCFRLKEVKRAYGQGLFHRGIPNLAMK